MNNMLPRLVTVIAVWAIAGPGVKAATLSPAQSVVVASCNLTQDMQSGAGPVSAACSDTGDFSGGVVEFEATAGVTGLPWPGASVAASARSDNAQFGQWLGYGQATLDGAIAIMETGVAPFVPESIPVVWRATGSGWRSPRRRARVPPRPPARAR